MMLSSTSPCSSILAAPSQPMMGEIFCFVTSAVVFVYNFIVLEYNAVSHCHATIAASSPSSREMSRNMNMFRALLTPSGSSVWKARPRRRNYTM